MPSSQELPNIIIGTKPVAIWLDRLCAETAHAINEDKHYVTSDHVSLKVCTLCNNVPLIMQEWSVQANDGMYVNKIRRQQQASSTAGAKCHSHSQENALISSSRLVHMPTVSGATACVQHVMQRLMLLP